MVRAKGVWGEGASQARPSLAWPRSKIVDTVKLGYVQQDRFAKDDERIVWECISGGAETILLGSREVNTRAYVAGFNFSGTDQQKQIKILSGGERNRVHLARA